MINKNPFSDNRAEYMPDVWKFYVPFSELNMDNAKPLVIEGGRGTGNPGGASGRSGGKAS